MKDIGGMLRDADPLRDEGRLSPVEASAMRRSIVAAAERDSPVAGWWPRPIFVGATIAVTLVAGIAVGRWLPRPDAADGRGVAPSSSAASHDRRQLQFATPGGTRIIWVFDPDFNP